MIDQEIQSLKGAADASAIFVTVATVVGWLPSIAALATIVWTVMRIVQDWSKFKDTIKKWFK